MALEVTLKPGQQPQLVSIPVLGYLIKAAPIRLVLELDLGRVLLLLETDEALLVLYLDHLAFEVCFSC